MRIRKISALATVSLGWAFLTPLIADNIVTTTTTTTVTTAPALSTGAATGLSAAPVVVAAIYRKPPKTMSANGAFLLPYYAGLWVKSDYSAMYGALSDAARENCPFDKFAAALIEAKKVNGGVKAFSAVKELRTDGYESEWSLTIHYVRSTAAPITVRVTLTKNADAWEIKEGGLLPLDETALDR